LEPDLGSLNPPHSISSKHFKSNVNLVNEPTSPDSASTNTTKMEENKPKSEGNKFESNLEYPDIDCNILLSNINRTNDQMIEGFSMECDGKVCNRVANHFHCRLCNH